MFQINPNLIPSEAGSFRSTASANSAGPCTGLDCQCQQLGCEYCVVDTNAAWVLTDPLLPTYGHWVMKLDNEAKDVFWTM